ncbi:MAG: transporter substrate-binding domain-containing protein [Bdellovibrio sp.]|nr:transporter substrate-binding domain-containing protein [Bdellovibrio sp.]
MKKNILALLLLIFFSQISFARSSRCENTYNVAANRVWPVSFPDKSGKMVGVGHDISQAIGTITGCRVIVDQVPSYRNWKALKDDTYDLTLLNIEDSGEYASYGTFIPVVKTRRVLVVNPSVYKKDWSIQQYIDAPAIKFSGLISIRFAYKKEELEALKKQHLYIETTDHENILTLIKKGTADATFFPETTFEYFKQNTSLANGLIMIPDTDTWIPTGIYLSKKRTTDRDLKNIQGAVTRMSSNGQLEKIFAKYGVNKASISFTP